jgi:hypothetical protein
MRLVQDFLEIVFLKVFKSINLLIGIFAVSMPVGAANGKTLAPCPSIRAVTKKYSERSYSKVQRFCKEMASVDAEVISL